MPVRFGDYWPDGVVVQPLSAPPRARTLQPTPPHHGTVCHWNADRNFGFVRPLGATGGREQNIFVIARLFEAAALTPHIGLRVQYRLGASTADGNARIAELWAEG